MPVDNLGNRGTIEAKKVLVRQLYNNEVGQSLIVEGTDDLMIGSTGSISDIFLGTNQATGHSISNVHIGKLVTSRYRKEVTTATYTAVSTDMLLGVTYTATGSVTINLPQVSTIPDKVYKIVDEGGNANVNHITVDPYSTETIVGESSLVINANHNSLSVYNDGGTKWFIA